jgi:hypothetical protein
MPIATTFNSEKSSVKVLVPGTAITANEVDLLIAELAAIRDQMIPEVPKDFLHGQPTHRHDGSQYYLGSDPSAGLLLLSFRSPALGWLTFGIRQNELERMHSFLQEYKARPPSP